MGTLIPADRTPKAWIPEREPDCSFCRISKSESKQFFEGRPLADGTRRFVCGACIAKFKLLITESLEEENGEVKETDNKA